MFILRKLFSKADGSIYRDPYPENMQRVTDLGTLILHRMSPTNSYPQGSGKFMKECKGHRLWKTPRKQVFYTQENRGIDELAETMTAGTGPVQMMPLPREKVNTTHMPSTEVLSH